jgi:hypothetical protein
MTQTRRVHYWLSRHKGVVFNRRVPEWLDGSWYSLVPRGQPALIQLQTMSAPTFAGGLGCAEDFARHLQANCRTCPSSDFVASADSGWRKVALRSPFQPDLASQGC